MLNVSIRSHDDNGAEYADAQWETLVDEFRAGVEALMRKNIQAAPGMSSTKAEYEAETRFEPIEDGVRIVVGTKGQFSLANALERGQKPWHEGPAFTAGTGGNRPYRSQRGATVFRTVSVGGKKRVIPIDSGYPNNGGGDWDHPGLAKQDLLTQTKDEAQRELLPRLYAEHDAR